MKNVFLGLVMAGSTLFASADALAANVWKSAVGITGIMSLTDGGFIIFGAAASAQECTDGKAFYVRANQNGQTSEGIKTSLALALTAFLTGKTVTLLYDNAYATCYVQVVQIDP